MDVVAAQSTTSPARTPGSVVNGSVPLNHGHAGHHRKAGDDPRRHDLEITADATLAGHVDWGGITPVNGRGNPTRRCVHGLSATAAGLSVSRVSPNGGKP